MLAQIIQAADSLSRSIPSFSDRFNFMLPLIVVLVILMFFLLLKSYASDHDVSDDKRTDSSRRTVD